MTAILSRETRAIEAELYRRELARRHLSWFIRYRMRSEGRPVLWNWHLDYLCELLEAVTTRDLKRLMVNMPPRFLKTEVACEAWHAWMIGRDDSPRSSMVSASYGADLAHRASARTLNMLGTMWYQALFPDIVISKATEGEWATTKGASRVAAGALGPITGKGGDHLVCVAAGMRVLTQRGRVPIERVRVGDEVITHLGRWRRVTGTRCNGQRRVIGISGGWGQLRCTADHMLYTITGWQRADEAGEVYGLRDSDAAGLRGEEVQGLPHVVRALPGVVRHTQHRVQTQASASVLFTGLLTRAPERNVTEGARCLRSLRPPAAVPIGEAVLFVRVPRPMVGESIPESHNSEGVPRLSGHVQAENTRGNLLFAGLCRQEAHGENDGHGESALRSRALRRVLLPLIHQKDQQAGAGHARSLPQLRGDQASFGSPSQREEARRSPGEPGDALLLVPRHISQDGEQGVALVYDLSVDEDRSFCVEGLIAHNCDDLLKPTDANSETVREKTNDWYGETFRSRLNDQKTGTITIIAQRLHERDPCGYLLNLQKNPDADQFYHVELPLEAPKAKVYRFGSFCYLRRPGELLHPARLDVPQVKALKATMRTNFDGQYNQHPVKMTGGMLRPALLNRDERPPQRIIEDLGLQVSIYLDLATKEKETQKDDPDFNVLEVWARDQLQRKWLLHVWRAQCSLDVMARQLIALKRAWKPRRIKGEKIGLQHAFRSVLMSVCRLQREPLIVIEDIAYATDATQKLVPLESNLNAGLVWVPAHATWLPDFEAEMRSAPKGAHDDQLTSGAQACNDLDNMPGGEAPPKPPEPHEGPPPITGDDLKRKREQQDRERERGER